MFYHRNGTHQFAVHLTMVPYDRNLRSGRILIAQATVITIVNYDHKTFIVQAADFKIRQFGAGVIKLFPSYLTNGPVKLERLSLASLLSKSTV